ncbi:MAG: 2-oxo acid dehydrogenase subunit E2 [Myxococcota bacterium]
MPGFEPLEKMSSWRRIAGGVWRPHTSPQVLGFDEIDTTEVQAFIADARTKTDERITVTHVCVKVVAEILRRNPDLNVLMIRGRPMKRRNIDIFVQVAVPARDANHADLSGIKITNADQKSIAEIAREVNGRANKVRKGQDKEIERTKRTLDMVPLPLLGKILDFMSFLTFDLGLDLSGFGVKSDPFGSACITNCASFHVNIGYAPLVPFSRTPMLFLLGESRDRPAVHNGELAIRPIMLNTATFDHRLFDGYQVGKVVKDYTGLFENREWLDSCLL